MKLSSFRPIILITAACLPGTVALIPTAHATPRFEVVQGFELGPEQPDGALVTDAEGNMYGTSLGGASGYGTVFKITPDGTITALHNFDGVNGQSPGAYLTAGADGNFYGISHSGGSVDGGNVFRLTPAGEFTVLHDFTGGSDGRGPAARLLLAADGNFYGSTYVDGANGHGTFFRITPGGVLTTIYDWAEDEVGWSPTASLIQGSDGNFYAFNSRAKTPDLTESGQIVRITPSGSASVVAALAGIPNMTFSYPQSLMLASDGNFYGLTQYGGTGGFGTVFKATPTGTVTLLAQFAFNENREPYGSLVEAPDGKLYGTSRYGGTAGHGTIFSITKSGVLTTLANLDYETGPANTTGGLVLQPDGTFLGLGAGGGTYYSGAAFRMTAAGEITVIAHFHGFPEHYPSGKLLQASDGNFYGRTTMGGFTSNSVFRVTPQGELTTFTGVEGESNGDYYYYHSGFAEGAGGIFGFNSSTGEFGWGEIYRFDENFGRETFYSFDGTTGRSPNSLIGDGNGNLYGTTAYGGSTYGGTVFKLNAAGDHTLLAQFDGLSGEPSYHPNPGLILASDGSLYGTTQDGGSEQIGAVFKVSPEGGLSLFEFTNAEVNGQYPQAGLMEASDGNLYGVLSFGGPADAGTVYKVTPDGEITTLHAFNIVNGGYPVGQLAEGPDGALYGVTTYGGTTEEAGTIFRITKDGSYSTVFQFDNVHGKQPVAGLTVGTDGHLYGTTSEGGVTREGRLAGGGQIFRIAFGAEVETNTATDIANNSAILNATVNPGGYPTTVSFQYGTSPDLASFTTITAGTIPAGTEPVNVQAALSGLAPETTYYFRAVAVNDETPLEQNGAIASFQTNGFAEIVVETANGRVLSNGSILSFGLVRVDSPENLTLTIRNTSATAPLTGVSATLSGGGAGRFAITGVPASTVPGSSSTTCTLRFNPTYLGLKSAKLTITSSDPDESPLELNVYGIALPKGLDGLLKTAH